MHLGRQHNQSAYITDLVLRDMSSQARQLTRDDVINLIQEYAGVSTGNGKKINTINDDCVLNSLKNLINL
jgi:hypothetical protein